MGTARKVKLLVLVLRDRVGLLAEISDLIAGARVNIEAICAYQVGRNAEFLILVDNVARAKQALAALGTKVEERDVVAVELANEPGQLAAAARKLAEAGINITYSWASTYAGKKSTWVLKTADAAKAVRALNR